MALSSFSILPPRKWPAIRADGIWYMVSISWTGWFIPYGIHSVLRFYMESYMVYGIYRLHGTGLLIITGCFGMQPFWIARCTMRSPALVALVARFFPSRNGWNPQEFSIPCNTGFYNGNLLILGHNPQYMHKRSNARVESNPSMKIGKKCKFKMQNGPAIQKNTN